MYNKLKLFILFGLVGVLSLPLSAKENIPREGELTNPPPTTTNTTEETNFRNDCNASISQIDLSINNVRARLLGGGDLWWDLSDGRYIIPNVGPGEKEVSSIFASAIWVGGYDGGGNLKIAAQTYRQGGNDFWPGPLNDAGETEQSICQNWDRHFKVSGKNINALQADYLEDADGDGEPDYTVDETVSDDLLAWPGRGNPYFTNYYSFALPNQALAPFYDVDADGVYDPKKGDFPVVEVSGCNSSDLSNAAFADEMIWWVYNDKGNIHTETGGNQIGMEIQALAFSYATNDEINNMSFYRYNLLNKATSDLNNTYIGQWVDPDLGCWDNDFVGANVERGLGIVYNGEGTDPDCPSGGGLVNGYGDRVPMLGVDYFRGPKDEMGNEIGMSAFVYYNNDFSVIGNPEIAEHFYGYLSGFWKDGSPVEYGGNGYQTGGGATPYMFPDDPTNLGGWSECAANNAPDDRRFVQASGPFTLSPGATNEIIVGAVWIPEAVYPCPSFQPLLTADDIAQSLFDNCFRIVNGPDAPDVEVIELDRELILQLSNGPGSNNYKEEYEELDPIIPPSETDTTYTFQGYLVYQLATPTVSPSEYTDPDQARLIAQFDQKDGASKLINFTAFEDPDINAVVPQVMVDGNDEGIQHTIQVLEDQFAEGDKRLINHKKYYFSAVAYGYNEYKKYDPSNPVAGGQKRVFLQGRRNIEAYESIPHITTPENNGTIVNATYGDAPQITRTSGVGNSGIALDLVPESRDAIFTNGSQETLTYQANEGPFTVQVVNPLQVQSDDYTLKVLDNTPSNATLTDSLYWVLENNSGSQWFGDKTIDESNETVLNDLGISVLVYQAPDAGAAIDDPTLSNGLISQTLEYADPNNPWLSYVPDDDFLTNYLRTGTGENEEYKDPNKDYSDNPWIPYTLANWQTTDVNSGEPFFLHLTPAFLFTRPTVGDDIQEALLLEDLPNVDIVFTSDPQKWSRCAVVETANPYHYNSAAANPIGEDWITENDSRQFDIRKHHSVSKEGTDDGDGDGMGWFPGYAVDVETGQRLNIFFGENTIYNGEQPFAGVPGMPSNGGDMIWNPTDDAFVSATPGQQGFNGIFEYVAGSQHTIYVSNTPYDRCETIRGILEDYTPSTVNIINETRKRDVLLDLNIAWTTMPILEPGTALNSLDKGLIPNDVTVKLRVDNPFAPTDDGGTTTYPTYQFSLDGFQQEVENIEVATNALDLINVVPNPYYAFSAYENTQFDNTVKITNLPPECIVTIYALDGRLIRRYNRNEVVSTVGKFDQILTSIDWDLKNSKSIPVASGVYIIHINAPGIGEKTVKWFGTMRKFDSNGL